MTAPIEGLPVRWQAGEVTLGAWCMMPGPLGVEAVAPLGFDWILIDMQHGAIEFGDVVEMIRAADVHRVAPVVRVPWNEPGIIGKVLDAGALGVVVPMIEGPEDARAAVDACLYPPAGHRSLGPIRVGTRDGRGYIGSANRRVAVIPMIETATALAHVEEIAVIDGVDALFVGPFDLSVALGLPPGDNDGTPEFDHAIRRVTDAANSAGVATAVLSNQRVAPTRIAQGFQMVSVSTDIEALTTASAGALRTVRESAEEVAS